MLKSRDRSRSRDVLTPIFDGLGLGLEGSGLGLSLGLEGSGLGLSLGLEGSGLVNIPALNDLEPT